MVSAHGGGMRGKPWPGAGFGGGLARRELAREAAGRCEGAVRSALLVASVWTLVGGGEQSSWHRARDGRQAELEVGESRF